MKGLEGEYIQAKDRYMEMYAAKAPGTSVFYHKVYAPKKTVFETAKSEFASITAKFEAEETRRAIVAREAALKEEKLKEHREKEAEALVSRSLMFLIFLTEIDLFFHRRRLRFRDRFDKSRSGKR